MSSKDLVGKVRLYEHKVITSYDQKCRFGRVSVNVCAGLMGGSHFPFTCSNMQVYRYVPSSLLLKLLLSIVLFLLCYCKHKSV